MLTALLCAVFLTGCQIMGDPGGLSLLQATASENGMGLKTVELAGGNIVVSGPEGYCIDASSLRSTLNGGFAALASCNILSDGTDGPIVEPVLATVIVKRFGDPVPNLSDIAAAMNTELPETRELSAVTAGRFETGGESAFQGSDPRHWRGVMSIGPYLVGVSLYAPEGSPLVGAQGAAFLNTISSRIRANSRTASRRADEAQTGTVVQEG